MGEERRLAVARITAIAHRLEAVRGQIVFIGGTVLPLLVAVDDRFHAPRMTDDVDAIGIAASYRASSRVEAAVAAAGFRRDITSRHKGRWLGPDDAVFDLSFAGNFAGASGAVVDELAIDTAMPMAGYETIRHLSPAGLFLMKCAAFRDRGLARLEDSKDLADLGVLLVGADVLAEHRRAPERVQDEVRSRAAWLAAVPSLETALLSHFADRRPKPPETAEELAIEAMKIIAELAR